MALARAAAIGFISVFAGCQTLPTPPPFTPADAQHSSEITALAFDQSGEALWLSNRADGSCSLIRLRLADRSQTEVGTLESCPERMRASRDDELLMVRGATIWFVDQNGGTIRRKTLPPRVRSPYFLSENNFLAIASMPDGEAVVRLSNEATLPLTPTFRAVDSFDVSPDQKEIVFSADAGEGFDVGLAPADGTREVRWIFPDRLPERGVSWAPRGNKVTYRLDSPEGTLLRTVHLPSSFQLAIDLPLTSLAALAWEPKAERFALVLSSPNRPDWIDLIRYGGEDRETLLNQGSEFDLSVDRAGEMLLLAPTALRYGETVPLLVWTSDESPFRWNPRLSELHKTMGVATAVGPAAAVDARFWDSISAIPWIDKSRIFVIYRKAPPAETVSPDSVTVLAPPAARQSITKRRSNWVSVPHKTPEEIERFAAEWIQRYLHARR